MEGFFSPDGKRGANVAVRGCCTTQTRWAFATPCDGEPFQSRPKKKVVVHRVHTVGTLGRHLRWCRRRWCASSERQYRKKPREFEHKPAGFCYGSCVILSGCGFLSAKCNYDFHFFFLFLFFFLPAGRPLRNLPLSRRTRQGISPI